MTKKQKVIERNIMKPYAEINCFQEVKISFAPPCCVNMCDWLGLISSWLSPPSLWGGRGGEVGNHSVFATTICYVLNYGTW